MTSPQQPRDVPHAEADPYSRLIRDLAHASETISAELHEFAPEYSHALLTLFREATQKCREQVTIDPDFIKVKAMRRETARHVREINERFGLQEDDVLNNGAEVEGSHQELAKPPQGKNARSIPASKDEEEEEGGALLVTSQDIQTEVASNSAEDSRQPTPTLAQAIVRLQARKTEINAIYTSAWTFARDKILKICNDAISAIHEASPTEDEMEWVEHIIAKTEAQFSEILKQAAQQIEDIDPAERFRYEEKGSYFFVHDERDGEGEEGENTQTEQMATAHGSSAPEDTRLTRSKRKAFDMTSVVPPTKRPRRAYSEDNTNNNAVPVLGVVGGVPPEHLDKNVNNDSPSINFQLGALHTVRILKEALEKGEQSINEVLDFEESELRMALSRMLKEQ